MAKLRDFAEVVMGQSPPGETVTNLPSGLPLLNGPTEFGGYHPFAVQYTNDGRKRAREGDLLFCVRGSTTGRMNWADQTYAIGRGVAAIRHKTQIECQPFIRAAIEAELPKLLAAATGSTFPNVSRDQLLDIEVPDIEESVQLTLSRVLAGFDLKIELNRRMNQTLEAMARALFKSWFVDFEPVVAKSEGRPTGLPPDIDALFPNEFEDSPLGEIPKGWTAGTIGDVAVNPKRSVSAAAIDPNEPYVGLEHIERRCLALSSWGSGYDVASQKSRFQEGELLFGKLRPYFHKVVIAPVSGVCSTDILVLDSREPCFWSFVVMACSETSTIDFVTASSGGTRMPRTSWSELARVPFVIPSKEAAAGFDQLARPMLTSLAKSVFECQRLGELRDDLLPRLLSGEVEVAEAEEKALA